MNLYDFTTIGISMIAFAFSISALLKTNKNSQVTASNKDENKTNIADLRNGLNNLQIENSSEFEKVALKIQKLDEHINISIFEINDFLRKQLADLSIDELRITISKIEVGFTEFSKASKSSLDYMLDLKKIIENDITKLYDSLSSEKKITAKNFTLINEQTNSKLINIEHRFETNFNEIASNTKVLKTDTKEIFKSIEKIDKLYIDFNDKFYSLTNQFESEKELLTGTVSEINSKFVDYDSKVSSLEIQIESEKELNKGMLSNLRAEVYAQIDDLTGIIEIIEPKIAKSLESQSLGHKESIKSLNTELNIYNKEIFNQFNTIEAIYNELFKNYESNLISINETVKSIGDKQSVLKLKIKKLSDQYIADTKDIEIKIDSTSKNLITRLEQHANKSTENYNRIEENFIREKPRISKALKLARTSLSGLQLLFQNRRKVDQLADQNSIKAIQPYVSDVARLGILNQLVYQRFNRNLENGVSEEIISSFKKHLNMELSSNKLYYMAHKVWMIEGCCVGRLATNVEDAIIRCLFAYKTILNNQGLRGLEIGTLFGINLCCLAELVSNHTKHFHFTIIDPLEGYYSISPNDIVVDEPVNEAVFFRNVTRYTLKKNVSLIKKFTTQLTKKAMPQKTYNYVLIDGDHTYEGVKLDFELFKDSIESGGFVLFDDYGTKDWPDVKRYVDKEVDKLDNFAKVFSISRTCVYQKQ